MRYLPTLALLSAAIYNTVFAERIAAKTQENLAGKPMPRLLAWVVGSPPSVRRIRTIGIGGLVLFGARLAIGLLSQ